MERHPKPLRNTFVDAFVVMPNHVHGIVFIDDAVGAQHAAPLPHHAVVAKGSLGAVVRSFKSAATKRLRELGLSGDGYLWQRNYYERIVRNEGELNRIREYIAYNPQRWHLDYEDPHREPDPKHDLDWAWLEDHTPRAT